MYKWIAGSTCAAAVLSLTVASAQTYPQTSDKQPTTRTTPSTQNRSTDQTRRTTSSNRTANAAQRVTVTGCVTQGSAPQSTSTANRSPANAGAWILSNATTSSETASTQTSGSGSPNNEGTSSAGVSGSTSTAVGTSGTSNDTSASASGATSYQLTGLTNPAEYSGKRVEITGMLNNARPTASSRRNSRNSNVTSGNSSMSMLRAMSVRMLGEGCQ